MCLPRRKMQLVCRDAPGGPANQKLFFAHRVLAVRHSYRAPRPDGQVIYSVPQNACRTAIVFVIVKNSLPDCRVALFHPSMKPLDRSRPRRMGITPGESEIVGQSLYREIPGRPFRSLFYHVIVQIGRVCWIKEFFDLLRAANIRVFLPELAVDRTLPIRLTPMTATCRVPPLSRVKLGIGWSRGVARDAEQ